MSLSLCMITKDEADMLPGFIESVSGLWDEWCVYDTGSQDNSIELLHKAGAKVKHGHWKGDFAQARNESLAMATGDWVLFLDADERPTKELCHDIKQLIERPDAGAATVIIHNQLPHGHIQETSLLRLFRNIDSISFCHRIHEDVTEAVTSYLKGTGLKLVNLPGKVNHLGYVREHADTRNKKERDLKLLHKCVEDNPQDYYSWYKLLELARFWNDQKLWQDTAKELLPHLNKAKTAQLTGRYASDLLVLIARGLYAKDPANALEFCNQWRERVEHSPALHLYLGELYERLGEYDSSKDEFAACLNYHEVIDPQQITVRPLLGLARLAISLGEYDTALSFTDQALDYNATDPEGLLSRVLLSTLKGGQKALDEFVRQHKKNYGETIELENALGEFALLNGQKNK
jgi:glycosyltransferase involved in cell wall biosynthesis